MSAEAVEGLADALATIERLPESAKLEFADLLGKLGRDVLAAQRARAPQRTGALAAGLSAELEVEDYVRLRVGLLTPTQSRSTTDDRSLYYGRFVEFGVGAQTVTVFRRRRVGGRLRTLRGRKRAEDIEAVYPLHVQAQAARPFVNVPDAELDGLVANRIADFWARTLTRAEA